jgi:hypothetical protein
MWLIPLGWMSVLIFSTTSSGVPATESFSAYSGLKRSTAPAMSPVPSASTTGASSAGSMPWRRTSSSGIEEM